MRRWIAHSIASALMAGAAVAAETPTSDQPPKPIAPLWLGQSSPVLSAPADAKPDFPPPADPPLVAPVKSESGYNRAIPAAPAIRNLPSLESSPPKATPALRSLETQSPTPAIVTPPAPTPAPMIVSEPSVEFTPGDSHVAGSRPYASAEYLLMQLRRGPTPPLIQVVTPDAANIALAGRELPPNSTFTVFNQFGTDPGAFSGARATLGYWLDSCAEWGAEIDYTQIFRKSDQTSIESAGLPVIGRYFFDAAAQRDAFLFFSQPDGSQRGYIRTDAPTQAIGGEFNVRHHGVAVLADRVDYLAGFRYFNLTDSVSIDSGSAFLDNLGQITTRFDSTETFKAKNDFYGGQVGYESHFYYGCWTLDSGGKVAIGGVHQRVNIEGSTTVSRPGQPTEFFPNQSLLYVQPTNAGSYSRDRFAVMPEVWLRLGYQLTPKIRATIGYDLIAISSVARAGSSIDTIVNPNNTRFINSNTPSTSPHPTFDFNGTDWWAQGLTAGFVVNY